MEHFHTGNGIFGQEYTQGVIDTQTRYDLTEVYNRQKVKQNPLYLKLEDFEACTDVDVTQIYKQDLVFMTSNKGRNNAGGGAGAKPVLSHLNGHYVKIDKDDLTRLNTDPGNDESKREEIELEKKYLLSKNIEFVGIALTKSNGVAKKGSSNSRVVEGSTIQIRGKNTILNSGDQQIRAGQKIVWDLPHANNKINNMRSDDRPSKKATLRTVPYHHFASELVKQLANIDQDIDMNSTSAHVLHQMKAKLKEFYAFVAYLIDADKKGKFDPKDAQNIAIYKSIVSRLKNENGLPGNNLQIESSILSKLLECLFEVVDDVDRRTIGTALSTANCGQKIDLVM